MNRRFPPTKKSNGVPKNRREEIIEHSAALFRERGFKGTSIQAIAEKVGLPPGGLYYYINSKEELLFEVATRGVRSILAALDEIQRVPAKPSERIYTAIHKHVLVLIQHQDYASVVLQEKKTLLPTHYQAYIRDRKQVERHYKKIIQEGVESGEFQPVNIDLVTFLILGMCNSIAQWYHPEGDLNADEIAGLTAKSTLKILT